MNGSTWPRTSDLAEPVVHHWDEPRSDDGPGTVALEEGPGAVDVPGLEQPGLGPVEHRRTGPPPDPPPGQVAGYRGKREQEEQQPQRRDQATGDEQAGGEQQRVTGEEEAHEQTALGEQDRRDPDQTDGVDQVRRIQEAGHRVHAGHLS
jgi:hypothetical protein